jgi:hypothetical protein
LRVTPDLMRQASSMLVVAAALVACRGETTAPISDAGPSFAPPPLSPGPAGTGPAQCPGVTWSVTFDHHSADVLVLFDRSGSMTTEFGDGTRYSVEAAVLSDLLGAYQDKLRFGFQAFPAKDDCAGLAPGCCAIAPSVPVGDLKAAPMIAAIADAAPVSGSTPTAMALDLARQYFQTLDDGVPDRYLLLATDGRPSCDGSGHLAEADVFDGSGARVAGACFDALAAVAQLTAIGVKVIVLGIGPGLADDPGGVPSCLEDLAAMGGLARQEGQPAFFSGSDQARLESALQQIFAGAVRPSCDLTLHDPPADPHQVSVLLDGTIIPQDKKEGWIFDTADPRHIEIKGEYCHRVMRFEVKTLEVRGGCPPCGKPTCE